MQISRTLFTQMCDLFAASTIVFVRTAGNEPAIHAIVEDFSYDPNLAVGDLTLNDADFDRGPMLTIDESDKTYYDPVTGEYVIALQADASGEWLQIANTVASPFTVYGYAFTTGDGVSLLAVSKSLNPVEVNAVGQGVVCRDTEFRLPPNMVR